MTTERVPMPAHIARLPRNSAGQPIPFFVHNPDHDPNPDFRLVSPQRVVEALKFERCWVCGNKRGAYCAFTIGPMCVVNRTTSEPPAHRDCAQYSVQACPFLSQPNKERRKVGLPENPSTPGIMIARNPGVAAIWITKRWWPRRDYDGEGLLFSFDDPTEVQWWRDGRAATHDEVLDSILAGMPQLRDMAAAEGPAAVRELEALFQQAMQYLP